MSHFSTAVLHRADQDVDEMLAPYSEHVRVPRRILMTKAEAVEFARENYEGFKDRDDEECWKAVAEFYPDDMKDEEGNLYTTRNPLSKWDYYEVGGRFSGLLRTKDGKRTDEGRVGDLDFSADKDAYAEALRFWDRNVEKKVKPKKGEEFFSLRSENYYKKTYGNREEYARRASSFSTYAVVTPDGEWHEKGEMGWWAISYASPEEAAAWADSYEKKFIESADPDLIMTIIDCHI